MNVSICNRHISELFLLSVLFGLLLSGLQAVLADRAAGEEAGRTVPKFYKGLLDGYYVELVVDWLPDKRVEGEIWTAAHKVTPRDLGFVFARVQGENERDGRLELEIVGDEVREKDASESGKRIGIAYLNKNLTDDYIEWKGEYRSSGGEMLPMIMYRERRQPVNKGNQEMSRGERGRAGPNSCEDGTCAPVRLEVCIETKDLKEAAEYFTWLSFPAEHLCGPQAERKCISESGCTGERWILEVDGFSEPFWEQELLNLPFIVSARRSRETTANDIEIVEMPISSFFSGKVPDHQEARQKINDFFHDYFSGAIASGNISVTMQERTKFNYLMDISGISDSELNKLELPGCHQLSIMMSQPYPSDHPDTFAIYFGFPRVQYTECSRHDIPPSDELMTIGNNGPSAFLEKLVSAFAFKYRASVWTP